MAMRQKKKSATEPLTKRGSSGSPWHTLSAIWPTDNVGVQAVQRASLSHGDLCSQPSTLLHVFVDNDLDFVVHNQD
jgi:hypothetical protein